MAMRELFLSAGSGAIASVITSVVTARLQMRREAKAWRRELTMKFAELSVQTDKSHAQAIAQQAAIGILIVDVNGTREKHFLPKNCRITVGRARDCQIAIDDRGLSRQHFSIVMDEQHAYVEDLGSANGVLVNDQRVSGRRRLASGEIVRAGAVSFEFWRLDGSPA